jgi:adenylate cyclase
VGATGTASGESEGAVNADADLAERLRALERQLAEVTDQQAATVEVLRVMGRSEFDLRPVFDTVIRNAVTLCRADAGHIWRLDGDFYLHACSFGAPDDSAYLAYHAYLSGVVIRPGKDTVVGKVALEHRAIHLPDVLVDRDYSFPEGQRLGNFRTLLGVPMMSDGVPTGVIILWRHEVHPFDDDQIEIVATFAAQGTIAIASTELFCAVNDKKRELEVAQDELAELNRTLESRVEQQLEELERVGQLKRFLSPQVVELVTSRGEASLLDTHRAEITAVFCDLRGFTAFSETVEPEEVIVVLRQFHEVVAALISEFGATLDHIAGDGILVFFNDPLPCPDPPGQAIRMALAMREQVGDLVHSWRKRGHELDLGIGIALGHATLGTIGSAGLFHYSSIGTVSNLAARLSDEAAGGQILVSARVHAATEGRFESEAVGPLELKGFARPVPVFNVLATPDGSPAQAPSVE